MKKYFLVPIVVLFIFITWYLVDFYHRKWQGREIESYRQYTSSKQDFTFNYPADWQLTTLKDETSLLNLFLRREDVGQKKVTIENTQLTPTYDIYLKIEENNQGLSAKDLYLSKFLESAKKEAEEKIKLVKFAGVQGIEYQEGAAPASGPATVVLLVRSGKVYQFTYQAIAHTETHEKYLPVFYQVIKSLKFTD